MRKIQKDHWQVTGLSLAVALALAGLLLVSTAKCAAQAIPANEFPSQCTNGQHLSRVDQGGAIYVCSQNAWYPLAYAPLPARQLAIAGTPANKLAPYATPVTAVAGNCCLSPGEQSKWTLTNGLPYRIRMSGAINRLRMSYSAACGTYTAVNLTIWRPSITSGFDLVSMSENLLPLLNPAGGLQDIALTAPLQVQEGDYYGTAEFGSTATNNCGPWTLQTDSNVNANYASNLTAAANGRAYTWTNGLTGQGIKIELYSAAPATLVAIGDSLISGYPANHDFCDGLAGAAGSSVPTQTIGYAVAQAMQWSWIDCGYSGQTTDAIAARFTADAIAAQPQVVLIEGGINDLNTAPQNTNAHILANWQQEISAAAAIHARPVCLLILPGAYTVDANMTRRDQLNAAIAPMCAAAGGLTVDAGPYVGLYRSTGPPGNFWDSLPLYDAGDHLHLNAAGYARVAQAVIDGLQGKQRR